MKHIFIIVEGSSDEVILSEILKTLLPIDIYKFHFYPAGGFYNALTSVRPILDLVSEESKVILVFDADTSKAEKAQERIDYINEYIGVDSYCNQFGVFTFIPTIDAVISQGVEIANIKRTKREDYNKKIKTIISQHINEIKNVDTIKGIVDFIIK